jgi:hypothetical protein
MNLSILKGLGGSPNSLNCLKVQIRSIILWWLWNQSCTFIYYCIHQYSLIFFETNNRKFLLNLILDWDLVIQTRFFCHEFKIGKFVYGVFLRFLYYLFIEIIFERSCFEPEKSIFEVKHTCTFWTIEYM